MTWRSHILCALLAAAAAAAVLVVPLRREVYVAAHASGWLCAPGELCVHAYAPREDSGFQYRQIPTHFGVLALAYGEGRASLLGKLNGGGSCANWRVEVEDRFLPWLVSFSVSKTEPILLGRTLCVEGVSERQPVVAEITALPQTLYAIRLEGELIFLGPIGSSPERLELVRGPAPDSAGP